MLCPGLFYSAADARVPAACGETTLGEFQDRHTDAVVLEYLWFWCFECGYYRKWCEFNFNVWILIYILNAIGKWYKLYAEEVKQYLDAERVSPSNLHLFNVSVQKYSKWKLRYSGFYKVVSYVWISMLFKCYKKGYKKKRCHRVRLLDFCALFILEKDPLSLYSSSASIEKVSDHRDFVSRMEWLSILFHFRAFKSDALPASQN